MGAHNSFYLRRRALPLHLSPCNAQLIALVGGARLRFLLLLQEHPRLGDTSAAPDSDQARKQGEDKGQPPTPCHHDFLAKGHVDCVSGELRKQKADVDGNGDQRNSTAQHVVCDNFGEVRSNGPDLTRCAKALNESQDDEHHKANVSKRLVSARVRRQQALPASAHEHADDGDIHRHAAAEAVADATKDDATQGPSQEGDAETEPDANAGASEEVLLQVGRQVAIHSELVPLDDVAQQQRPIHSDQAPEIRRGSHGSGGTRLLGAGACNAECV
mmetsp:Transcript_91485/g.296057  ORF Transcript_91485/g.296057 Transcript_91485/m.296057 type:complete len:273 (-) Transcript_91485:15-833(-)